MNTKSVLEARVYPNLTLLVIMAVTVIAFLPSLFNGFQMGWDDQWMVVNPITPKGLDIVVMKHYFTEGYHGQYSPLNQLMYSILYAIDGYNPMVYHAACLIFHLLNIVLVYRILGMIMSDCCCQLDYSRIYYIVILCSVFFAIHPLQVESVAWISASKNVLSTFFYLLASYIFIIYIKQGGLLYYLTTIVLFGLAYLVKEQVVTFSLWITLLYTWYGNNPRTLKFWKTLSPLYAISFVCGLFLLFPVFSYDSYIQGGTYQWWQRLVFAFYSFTTYFCKWIFPSNLSWMYHFPVPLGSPLPEWMLLYPILVCVITISFWKSICNRYISSALLFTLVHLLFVLHFIVLPRAAIIADRYMYLPILGFSFIFAYIITSPGVFNKCGKIIPILVVLQIVAYSVFTHLRTMDWKDSQTLKKELYRDNDSLLTTTIKQNEKNE